MRRADAGTGEHGDGELRNHAHVDADAVSLGDTELAKRVGQPRDLAQHLRVGQVGALAPGLPDPVIGDAVAPARLDMTIEAVRGDVQLAVGEPRAVRRIPLEPRARLLEPADELAGQIAPETLGIFLGAPVDGLVLDHRVGGELLGRWEGALLVEQRLDCGLRALGLHGPRL